MTGPDPSGQVCVVGLGKIGLPLAVQYASRGLRVVGCDVSAEVVEAVNRGQSPIAGEEELDERLAAAVGQGLLRATIDTAAAVAGSGTVVIIVPVFLTAANVPDLSVLDAATEVIARGLQKDTLVLVESTMPVGTTRGRVGTGLEASGLTMGRDFRLAYSPERVYSGRIFADLRTYPKVVGGIDEESTQAAARFYSQALGAAIITVRDAETAEFVKLAESVYRDANIALANELARAAAQAGVDVGEAIAAANSQPFSHIHQPGVGVGGHCMPVNPYFLIDGLGPAPLTSLARQVNDGMAQYAQERLAAALGGLSGCRVLILGLAYRANVKESIYSSALLLSRVLSEAGAAVLVHDPLFSPQEIEELGLRPASLVPPPAVDAVVVQAFHDEYRGLDLSVFQGCRAVLDGRNVLSRQAVEACGMKYLGIGR